MKQTETSGESAVRSLASHARVWAAAWCESFPLPSENHRVMTATVAPAGH